MKREMIYIVIDGVDIKAYNSASKADKAYMNILRKRWHGNFDDYGRAPGKAILEHYTCIDGRNIMRRAIYLEKED